MGQTLVVAEKPSVGRDIAAALPGTFKSDKDKTHLVGDDYVITWTVGHLVGLADPEEYDAKLKKWRYADLPIVPDKFKLVPNDAKAEKQLKAIHRLTRSDDIDVIVNACDAGREGELIFAYTYEASKSKKPVKRLWLSSMTRKAIHEAFQRLRHRDRRGHARQARHDHQAREEGRARAAQPALRPDDPAAPREHAVRLLGPAHALGRPGAVRAPQGDHLPAHQLQVPLRRPGARDQADR